MFVLHNTVEWNSAPAVTTLHGVVVQGVQQLVCATYSVLSTDTLMCHDPLNGGALAFSQQLTAHQFVPTTFRQWLLVQDWAKEELAAIDPFTRTVAWTIPAGGVYHVDVADDESFLLLSSPATLWKWIVSPLVSQ
ncbi:uncharacterized protein ACA1_185300 [Acanthamoeba castellanii str. Neff]|uniref:Uncharacterized protein n=1 Tax=Acanthamoeba castellanii (strain ATCC 30010 / Neff) TaxID=1257118 RepID=L8H523_ACACF|nr:uncharacterized protein ACA1_185300 [Acanthamoeba castellanii str. Neff]ELR20337.1 hypothetical protein ACA1_185300 [Acanthamoeba castellanii str. Neff]